MLTREQAVPGTKVKIPTRCTDTSSTYKEFNEEFNALDYKPDYLYFVGDFMGSAEVSVTTKRDTLNCCLFSYEDLDLYEEPTTLTTEDRITAQQTMGELADELALQNALNPSHYQVNGEQVWDQMLRLFGTEKMKAFCEVNAYKYFSRAGKKAGNPLEQDMEKATWYLRKLRELENDK